MKRLLSMSLCVILLLLSMTGGFAVGEQKISVLSNDGRTVNFTIESNVKGKINRNILLSLANENKDTENIIIYEVGYAEPLTQLKEIVRTKDTTPMATMPVIGPVLKKYNQKDVFESDRFMASCAKGETKTITTTVTEKLEAGYTGLPIGLDLNDTISYSITKGQTLTGPPENSSYNSREYRCKFYEHRGIWSQLYMDLSTGNSWTLTGDFNEPSYYVSYSKDTYVR